MIRRARNILKKYRNFLITQIFFFKIRRIIRFTRLLVQDVFACFLSPNYADNYYLFEKKLHTQKRKWLRAKIKLAHRYQHHARFLSIIDELDQIFVLILNMAQLRHRVTDHHEFAVCQRELLHLLQTTDRVFKHLLLRKNMADLLQQMLDSIEDFIAIYQQILSVSAKDPYVFVVFITSLNMLYKMVINLPEKSLDIKRI